MKTRVLFDTHILLWALSGDAKLPPKALEMIDSPDYEVFYSSVSVWEVAIKYLKNPEKIDNVSPERFVEFCDASEFWVLPLMVNHVMMLKTLSRPEDAPAHNDPFDRILLAQAKSENMLFITHDTLIAGYNEPFIICA